MVEGASNSISELTKEVNSLTHLKQENVKLIEEIAKFKSNWLTAEATATKYKEDAETMANAVNSHKERIAELESKSDMDYVDWNDQKNEIEKLKTENLDLKTKHPMYPIHWGGYDGACSEYPEQYSKWLNEQKDKAIAEKKQKVDYPDLRNHSTCHSM
jgi:myosin heavy subunit